MGRVWPAEGVSATRDTLVNQKIKDLIIEIPKNDQIWPICELNMVYFSILRPVEPFKLKTEAQGDIFHPNVAPRWI